MRKSQHKTNANNEKNGHQFLYKTIREHGGWDQFNMVLVEQYPCKNNWFALAREQHWITQLKANMNQKRAASKTKCDFVEGHFRAIEHARLKVLKKNEKYIAKYGHPDDERVQVDFRHDPNETE